MIARAYLYAETEGAGNPPGEIQLLRAIDRFGAQAVFGRPLGAGEIKRMNMSEYLIKVFGERVKAENWPKWNKANPEKAKFLDYASKLAREYGE